MPLYSRKVTKSSLLFHQEHLKGKEVQEQRKRRQNDKSVLRRQNPRRGILRNSQALQRHEHWQHVRAQVNEQGIPAEKEDWLRKKRL